MNTKANLIKVLAALALACPAALLTNCGNQMKIKTLPYPQTLRQDVSDNYHGTVVADPYRWLEDDNSEQTADWVAAQNEVTFDYLTQIPYREQVRKRITELSDYPREDAPERHGEWYYWLGNNGLQNQNVLYRQRTLDSQSEVMLDPNTFSEDGTAALGAISWSKDGRYMSYGVSAAGSDWVEIFTMDTHTRELLPEVIKWVKFGGAVWAADSKGFYYSGYDEPAKGTELSGQNRFQKVFYHKLGQPQTNDALIHKDDKNPLRYFDGQESHDGKYLFVSGSEGTSGVELLYRETARASAPFKVLFPGFKNDYLVVHCEGSRALIYTNDGAPNYRLVEVDLTRGAASMRDVIAEGSDRLQDVESAGGYLMASYLKDATSAIYQHDMAGKLIRRVELPALGTAAGFSGESDATETFYSLASFTSPSTVYRYDMATGESSQLRETELKFDPELFTTEQVFFTSKDGTRVPMFITRRKDTRLDGANPTYMFGYGGFDITYTPSFSANNIMFLEQGGIYVVVNLRGGGEYGEQWHKAGMLSSKQNVFDDFIAAGEYLISEGYTSSEKLAIGGGSNGGLLVGACMTQRPDLFAVAVPQVGVLDMLRYHKFTVGWGWVVEYGSSDNAEQFGYIYKYSPLHNIHPGECYPATLILTADHDDRVVPAHSFKFAATLQPAQGCDKPVLIRIDTNAGHGAGKPTAKRIEDAADIYSFILWNTGAKVKF